MKKLDCCHYDTCLPDYFGGHPLPWLCIPVYRGMTLKDVKSSLLSEANQGAFGGARDYETLESEGFYRRVRAAINRIEPAVKGTRRFFLDLEPDPDDCGESVYAYFVFMEAE